MFVALSTHAAEAHKQKRYVKKTPIQPEIVQQSPKTFIDLFSFQPGNNNMQSQPNSLGGILKSAENYIGVNDRKGRAILMKLFNDTFNSNVDPSKTSWCAAFANSILDENKMPVTNSLKADSFRSWGKSTNIPKPGDIVLLKFRGSHISHVSFYVATIESPKGKCVQALGGNQSHEVKYSCYPMNKVAEFRTLS